MAAHSPKFLAALAILLAFCRAHADPAPLPRGDWTATADSEDLQGTTREAALAIDGETVTHWHTRWEGVVEPLPHQITIDTKAVQAVSALTYLPRQDTSNNGNIGLYEIYVSNSTSFSDSPIQTGTFADSKALKTVAFDSTVYARYFRLTALSEAGGRGQWSSASEINLLSAKSSGPSGPPPLAATEGSWSAVIELPLVAVAAAVLPNENVLMWSAFSATNFGGSSGLTQTATYNPNTGQQSQREVDETNHDMFCPGINFMADGTLLVAGGSNEMQTSLFDWQSNTWESGGEMNIARGYNGNTLLSDGRAFTLGGSWSGGLGGKDGETWSASDGWRKLEDVPVEPILTDDPAGVYRADNHGWFFGWTDGRVFHAGPSKQMNWFETDGSGDHVVAGERNGPDAMNGNAVMYDAGKILVVGGGEAYNEGAATTNAEIIELDGLDVRVKTVSSMTYARSFHSSCVLPDGKVLVAGGQPRPKVFTDTDAALVAELWDPETEEFTPMAPMTVPRTYHSVGLLLADARVFMAGGGLCGNCAVNHLDAEIFSPPYLFNADGTEATRPIITRGTTSTRPGQTFYMVTDSQVTSFSMIRNGAATHAVNNDQRRIALEIRWRWNNIYAMSSPADAGITLPGFYMVFAMNSAGTPSKARMLRVNA